jgi:hypothetical protein
MGMSTSLRKLSLVCYTPAAALIVVRYTPVAGLNQNGATYQNRTDIYWLEASHNSLYTNVAFLN